MPTSRVAEAAKKPKKTNAVKKKRTKSEIEKVKPKKVPKKMSVVAKKGKVVDNKVKKKVVARKVDANKTASSKTIKRKPKVAVLNSKILTSPETSKAKKGKKSEEKKISAKKCAKKKVEVEQVKLEPPQTMNEMKEEVPKKVEVPKKAEVAKKVEKKKQSVKTPKKSVQKKVKVKTEKVKSPKVPKASKAKVVEKVEIKVEPEVETVEESKKIVKDEIIDSKETIAKLLKEANKSMQLKTSKKKRDALKVSVTGAIHKKPKISKQKGKKEIKQEYEEDVVFADIKQVAKLLKPIKKIVKNEKVEKVDDVKEGGDCENERVNTDDSSTSDEMTLDLVRQNHITDGVASRKGENINKPTKKINTEQSSDNEKKTKSMKVSRKIPQKKKMVIIKKRIVKQGKVSSEEKNRRMKVYGFWNGPKRHRVASLNALAKVHCLYENESRGALYDVIKRSPATKEHSPERDTFPEQVLNPVSTRTLRSVPGLRGVGKHWEMHDETSSSSEDNGNDSSLEGSTKAWSPPPSYKKQKDIKSTEKKETKKEFKKEIKKEPKKQGKTQELEDKPKKKVIRKRRTNRTELIMDLKDMVVRKRMASLNASAILAASYSVEKKPMRSPRSEDSSDDSDNSESSLSSIDSKRQCYEADIKKEEDRKVIEVHASPNKKVAVILNQDTDVTITGVYVNSTTRSTHHEGFCSIAGMQYRISATSHTQTNAVATETILHSTANPVSPPTSSKLCYSNLLFSLRVKSRWRRRASRIHR